MTRCYASWVVPVTSPPIRDGWIDVEGQRISGFGGLADRSGPTQTQEIDLTGMAILPSLVNTHTHLELSGLRGHVPPTASMPVWVDQVFARAAEVAFDELEVVRAVEEARAAGTGLVGDITNTLTSVGPLSRSAVDAVVFKELLGFNETRPEALVSRELAALSELQQRAAAGAGTAELRFQLAAHAPYSVSPALFESILDAVPEGPLCVHLAESSEELMFLRSGEGPWRSLLDSRGRWDPTWQPFDAGPVAYLDRYGWITSRSVIVHGVQLTDHELERLASVGATLVTCPRSNRWTGAGTPPISRFYASGVRVAVGTDSLASAPDLNLFAELAEIRRLAPAQPASALLRSATQSGAEALGWPDRGAIIDGMRASLIAVRCPATVDDVEEYLVNGVAPEDVRWLDDV